MKKKTVYNILMLLLIGVIAAGAVFFAGRHLGWFDKPAASEDAIAVNATVRKGLATLKRGGIATELSGETVLRPGDVVSVTSGCTAVRIGDGEVLVNQEGALEFVCADGGAAQVRLVSGEAFCQTADTPVTLLWGEQSTPMQNSTLVCNVYTGSRTLYVLSGEVNDGTNTLSPGQMDSYAGEECSVQALDLQALSAFALDCILSSDRALYCSREQVQAVLDARSASMQPAQGTDTQPAQGTDTQPTTTPTNPSQSSGTQGGSGKEEQPSGLTCTIEIRCDTILNNRSELEAGLDVYVPEDGVILPTTTATFEAGETVFDVLKRICAERNIQLEYSYTPLYKSYYIEGINHLYEFSCGAESGWMYKVNGWFPNYGCSAYKLQGGETVVWAYTCHGLGADVGAPSMG